MGSPMASGSQPEPPPGRVAAVKDAIEAWSSFEQFFVLSYRATQGTPILVTELGVRAAAVLGTSPEAVANDPGGFARLLHPDDRDRVLGCQGRGVRQRVPHGRRGRDRPLDL
jgi:hypothetical protein